MFEAVAGARGVVVVAPVAVDEPVVRRVVDPLEREHGTEVVALRGVVVDDVEDDLDAGRVQGLDHPLELLDLLTLLPRRRILVVRRQVPIEL